MINRTLAAVLFIAALVGSAFAQGGPGGPGPVPDPWTVNGPVIYFNKGSVNAGSGALGNTGAGTFNAANGYYLNGVLVETVTSATAPINFAAGAISLNIDTNFAVSGSNLALHTGAAGCLIANATGGVAEPSCSSWTSFADQAIGNSNGMLPYRTGGSWGTISTGTSGGTIPLLNGNNTWSGTSLFNSGTTFGSAITYGGVTLSNAVTGTGSMVLAAAPTITGHPTIEGVTSTGATGTGKFVFDTSPTLTTPNVGVAAGTSLALGGCTIGANALCVTGASALANTAIGAGSAITSSGPGGSLTAVAYASFGTASGNAAQGGVITAGGPVGSATVAPIITYNAAGQLTTVSSATITPAVGSITGLGTGVATALGVNVGTAGSPVVNGGALGTPSSGTLTNETGLPISTGVSGLGTGVATFLGTPTFSNLSSAVTGQTIATLTAADQTLSGGANVTAANLGTKSSGTTTIDCGTVPLQYLTNGGAFTLAAPSNDGSCIVQVTNNGSAGTITFSGFTVGSNTGSALDTTNAHKFMISIARVNGSSVYNITAQQ